MRPGPQQFARRALRLANRMLGPLDLLAFSDQQGSDAPIIVVGLPRSGTTLTYEVLVQAFETGFMTPAYAYAYGAPNILTRIVARRTRNPVARYESNYGRIQGRFSPAENSVFWTQWFPERRDLGHYTPTEFVAERDSERARRTLRSMSAIAARPFVFKNVYLTLSLPAVLQVLPNARVIIVNRDIRSTIASVYKKRRTQSAWWSLRPPFAEEMRSRSTFEQTVFQCVRSKQILDDALSRLRQSRYLAVDYASLCADPHAFVRRVDEWAGPEFRLRGNASIPPSFPASPGPAIPQDESGELQELMDQMDASAEDYLDRISDFTMRPG